MSRDAVPFSPVDGVSDQAISTHTDLVVVGSGVAGLTAALAAAEAGARVMLLTGTQALSGSSPWAQGGIAAALGPDDSPARHQRDTIGVGVGLTDVRAVHVLVHEGRERVRALLAWGVPFADSAHGLDLTLEAGHSRRRILHAGGGATGRMVTEALLARAAAHPRIDIRSHTPAEALVTTNGRVTGVRSGPRVYEGRAVVLATGGYAGLWRRTTNQRENQGVGAALAWWVGASLADLEFVQFHPTALALPDRLAFLLSEALRGEGAHVVDGHEQPIVDPLQPRDVVARAIAHHWAAHGTVYLTLRHLDAHDIHRRFPAIAAQLRLWGLDLARDLLPIAPAAHYCMGGIRTDAAGRTDVPGLYAAGEVACTGVQGANRLASNSLLECLVFGTRAALAALHDAPTRHARWETTALPARPLAATGSGVGSKADLLDPALGGVCGGQTLWQHQNHDAPSPRKHHANGVLGQDLDRALGVAREAASLSSLVHALPTPGDGEVPPSWVVATLAAHAAVLRTESRGAHCRLDWPQTVASWRGRIHWRRGRQPQFERIVP